MVFAQDLNLKGEARYGTVTLEAGFASDPWMVPVIAGGAHAVTEEETTAGCGGFVEADGPDVELDYTAGVFQLSIYVRARTDTVLVINTPEGDWICNDQFGPAADAGVVLIEPESGVYDIWIGTDETDQYPAAGLYFSEGRPSRPEKVPTTKRAVDAIDWGDDSSTWANDGECDDPRFTGPGASNTMLDTDLGRDASDCQAQFEAGGVSLLGEAALPAALNGGTDNALTRAINWGTDDGPFAFDGECDDPRFSGPSVSTQPGLGDLLRDATDCREAFAAGAVTLVGEAQPNPGRGIDTLPVSEINFGNDSGDYPQDGQCHDPRFGGAGVASMLHEHNRLRDAADCQALYEAGKVVFRDQVSVEELPPLPPAAPTFGDDTGALGLNGRCEDPRFEGEGMGLPARVDHELADATDCQTLLANGMIQLYDPQEPLTPVDSINWGDDSSQFAFDSECDDPRFFGLGTANIQLTSDQGRDATDCRQAYESGVVRYIGG
jgi:hypothetical protein